MPEKVVTCPNEKCKFAGGEKDFAVSAHSHPSVMVAGLQAAAADIGFGCPKCGTRFGFACGMVEYNCSPPEKKDIYVVIGGNPFDGMSVFGPFGDAEEGNEWAQDELKRDTWWTMKVEEP